MSIRERHYAVRRLFLSFDKIYFYGYEISFDGTTLDFLSHPQWSEAWIPFQGTYGYWALDRVFIFFGHRFIVRIEIIRVGFCSSIVGNNGERAHEGGSSPLSPPLGSG